MAEAEGVAEIEGLSAECEGDRRRGAARDYSTSASDIATMRERVFVLTSEETIAESRAGVFGTFDALVKFGDVGRIANDESGTGVDDGRDTLDYDLASHIDRVHINLPISLLSNGDSGEITTNEIVVDAAEEKLSTVRSKLEAELTSRDRTLLDESVEEWGAHDCELRPGQTHQTVRWELGAFEAGGVGGGASKDLIVGGETGDGHRVSKLLAADGRAIAVCEGEFLPCVRGGGALGWVVFGVTGAGGSALG